MTLKTQQVFNVSCKHNRAHTPGSCEFFSCSSGPNSWLLLPSVGPLMDLQSVSAVVLDGGALVTSSSFILTWWGLPERLRLRLPLRWPRCLLLRGLGLRDLIFMTTVLSSSEVTSELSEELVSSPEVGSRIWRQMEKSVSKSGKREIKRVQMQMRTPKERAFGCFHVKQAVGCNYLKWLCYTHNAAHVVAIVTQDKVSWAFRQFLVSKGYLEISR